MSNDSRSSERDTTALIAMTVFAALIAGMLVGAWIYTDVIDKRDAEIDKLQEENSAYKEQVEQLETDIEQKQQRLESLKGENAALGEDVDAKCVEKPH